MKKLFLFACLSIFSFTFSSCSDNDNNSTDSNHQNTTLDPQGTISFKVDGEQKTFTGIDGSIFNFYETGNELEFTGSNNGSSSEFVTFHIAEGATSVNQIHEMTYTYNSSLNSSWDSFSSNVLVNDGHTIQANFSGVMYIYEDGTNQLKQITDGHINITY